MPAKPQIEKIHRDSGTGRFTTKEEVKKNPKGTETETRTKPKK